MVNKRKRKAMTTVAATKTENDKHQEFTFGFSFSSLKSILPISFNKIDETGRSLLDKLLNEDE